MLLGMSLLSSLVMARRKSRYGSLVLSAWVGESPSGIRRPRPPVLYSVTGVGYPTPRMYWLSRFASPESSVPTWSLPPLLN